MRRPWIESCEKDQVFVSRLRKRKTDAFQWALATLDKTAFDALVNRLLSYRLLRHDPSSGLYTVHPLIRDYYYRQLTNDNPAQAQVAHRYIKNHYLATAGLLPFEPMRIRCAFALTDAGRFPGLAASKPLLIANAKALMIFPPLPGRQGNPVDLIEVVYHACRANACDEGNVCLSYIPCRTSSC